MKGRRRKRGAMTFMEKGATSIEGVVERWWWPRRRCFGKYSPILPISVDFLSYIESKYNIFGHALVSSGIKPVPDGGSSRRLWNLASLSFELCEQNQHGDMKMVYK